MRGMLPQGGQSASAGICDRKQSGPTRRGQLTGVSWELSLSSRRAGPCAPTQRGGKEGSAYWQGFP